MLVAAFACKTASWAAYYAIFSLIAALYAFDPVGLNLSGRNVNINLDGQNKTRPQNAFCILIFILTCVVAYTGYLFKISL
jgi:hypothetical protein